MPTDIISSKQNAQVKRLRALAHDAREVRSRGLTLIDGPHLLSAFQQAGGIPEQLVVSESGLRNTEVASLLGRFPELVPTILTDTVFRDVSDLVSPVGVLAVIAIPVFADTEPAGSCALLDAVQDAGNVGSILRSAAAAGVGDVYLGAGCASAWTPKVLRAAQGAHFSLRIHEHMSLTSFLTGFRGTSIATVVREAASIYDVDMRERIAWIFGNEGAGVSDDLVRLATERVSIPLVNATESLNVAAAAAICFYEEYRQKYFR